MAQVPSDWEFVLSLPNLQITPERLDQSQFPDGIDLGTNTVSIRGGEDPLVTEIRIGNPAAEQILGSFRNEYGETYTPSVLLVRKDAPQKLKTNAAAFNDFRNSVALSMVLPGRAAHARGQGFSYPNWADTFDFHPAQINVRGDVVIQSPALTNSVGELPLYLSGSPSVSIFSLDLHADRYLYRCFSREWQRRYMRPARNDRFSRTLFRSLEVAYQAASLGVKSFGSPVEYGTQIALWVSAIEILAWPPKGPANLFTVFDLLGKAHPPEIPKRRKNEVYDKVRKGLLHRRYAVKWRNQHRRIDTIQHCYSLLYGARNQFLHGNPVSFATLIARRPKKRLVLTRAAGLIYRYALAGYLASRYRRIVGFRHIGRDLLEYLDEQGYDDGLIELSGLNK